MPIETLAAGTTLRCPRCGQTLCLATEATYALCHERHRATRMEVVIDAESAAVATAPSPKSQRK